ncbi:chromate transporter [Ancylobacter terrae]|uniref:chromate transporter n=1 Tax=Ancylobacter sp. sgz301288 TaxID=3342077 RepID=UPI00385F3E83
MAAEISPDVHPTPAEPAPVPTLPGLFFGFLSISVIAFGGVLPIARRALVERLRWLTAEEFTELVGLSQFLPGPNICNLAVVLGARYHGPVGALVAFLGLTLLPAFIVIGLYLIFTQNADIRALDDVLAGLAAAAAGLVLSMAARMAEPMWRRPTLRGWAVALAGFGGIVGLGISLPTMMVVLAPISVVLAWRALE